MLGCGSSFKIKFQTTIENWLNPFDFLREPRQKGWATPQFAVCK